MEDEIQEALEQIYKFSINVSYSDLRKYTIYGTISSEVYFQVDVTYDYHYTKENNIQNFCNIINKAIIEALKF